MDHKISVPIQAEVANTSNFLILLFILAQRQKATGGTGCGLFPVLLLMMVRGWGKR